MRLSLSRDLHLISDIVRHPRYGRAGDGDGAAGLRAIILGLVISITHTAPAVAVVAKGAF